MPGFTAHLADVMGEVTTDWYGNPLCTTYRPTTAPGPHRLRARQRGPARSSSTAAASASATWPARSWCPNMGPDRYAVTVLAPARTVVTPRGLQPTCRNKDWVKTTTLEGGPDWDTWIQEGATGYDTEFLHSGEPTPWTPAGFVCPRNEPNANPNERRHRRRPRHEGARLLPVAGRPPLQRHRRRRLRRHQDATARSAGRGSRSRACRAATSPPQSCAATPTAHSRSRASRPATTWSPSGTSRSTTSSTATT